ncbi:MAG: hypothetical protein Q9217_001675 [Psora testacea]
MTDPSHPETPSKISSLLSPRSRKQSLLFAAGASFLFLSTSITRRSLVRRHASIIPKFYHPSNRPPSHQINGAFEAFEALNLATINVTSFMMMVGGGLIWAFDISSIEDMRRKVRGGLGVDGSGRSERDVEEEFEEWVASVLKRKEDKERRMAQANEADRDEEIELRRNERGRPR